MMKPSDSVPCPYCRGDMAYRIEARSLVCDSCSMKLTPEEYDSAMSARNRKSAPKESAKGSETVPEGLRGGSGSACICFACGSFYDSPGAGRLRFCPSCGTEVLYSGRFLEQGIPDLIVPFEMDMQGFMAVFRKRAREKLFIPESFLRDAKPENVRPVYVPFWVFDTEIFGEVYFTAETAEHYCGDVKTYSVYQGSAAGSQKYFNVSWKAAGEFQDRTAEILKPYDFNGARPYHPAWLSGFYTADCSLSSSECYSKVRTEVSESFDRFLANPSGYSRIRYDSRSYTERPFGVRYALFPFWTAEMVWHGRRYEFVMNGQNGKCLESFPETLFRPLLSSLFIWFLSGTLGMLAAIPFRDDPMTWLLLFIIYIMTTAFFRYVAFRYLLRTNLTATLSALTMLGLGCLFISMSGPLFEIFPKAGVLASFLVYLLFGEITGMVIIYRLSSREAVRNSETSGCDENAGVRDSVLAARNRTLLRSEHSKFSTFDNVCPGEGPASGNSGVFCRGSK